MPAQGGLAAMIAQSGASGEVVKAAQQIEAAPGGPELLYTFAAEEMMKGMGATKKQAKKIRLYNMGGPVEAARGGSTKAAAERTRRAGRGDDSMMLHMSPDEYDVITSMWGEPEMNPNTGIGEYGFLSKAWKGLKKGVKKVVKSKAFKMIAPIALSVFAPGLGTAIGGALLGSGASAAAVGMVGNAVIQGGLGAVSGGRKGALRGAIAGAVAGGAGAKVGKSIGLGEGRLADTVGSALLEGGGAELTGGDFASGAIRGGLGAYTRPMQERMVTGARQRLGLEGMPIPLEKAALVNPITDEPIGMGMEAGMGLKSVAPGSTYTPEVPLSRRQGPGAFATPTAAAAAPAPGAQVAEDKGLLGGLSKHAIPLLLASGVLSGGGRGREAEEPDGAPELPEIFRQSMPQYRMDRRFQAMDPTSYYTYGQAGSPTSGEHLFITPPDPFAFENQGMPPPGGLGQAAGGYQRGGEFDYWEQNDEIFDAVPTVSARGGSYTRGPGTGRSDDIEARLSDGEYVMDAETVSLLGDGSGAAGARRLDEMRRNLRKHKGQNLKKGEFSLKAKKPDKYMGKMRRLRRSAKYEHGGVMNVAGTSPPHMGATGENI